MGARDATKALAEGQRAARSVAPEWGRATPHKLWPKANAQADKSRRERRRGFYKRLEFVPFRDLIRNAGTETKQDHLQ